MPTEATIDSSGELLNRGKDPFVSPVSSFARSSVASAAQRISAASTLEQLDIQIVVLRSVARSITSAIEHAFLEIESDQAAA